MPFLSLKSLTSASAHAAPTARLEFGGRVCFCVVREDRRCSPLSISLNAATRSYFSYEYRVGLGCLWRSVAPGAPRRRVRQTKLERLIGAAAGPHLWDVFRRRASR